ncbi:MAG: glutamine--fructose-6-phosphate transaminase (isomerizing) [Gammaproteobacteria bacterium]|nr:glutamine--fructose-6-phosphate transaminase (isomerizing) [Gammaproteobacteria bacterium]
MCGIVGAIAERNVTPILMEGLRRLEYRGYDSAGIALEDGGTLQRVRREGKLRHLEDALAESPLKGFLGIAHTRWATHGAPSEINAHPHTSGTNVAVVHNGIIENHDALRAELAAEGYEFTSETDSEVVAHRVRFHLTKFGNLLDAVRATVAELKGAYALVVMDANDPDALVLARSGGPVVIGLGIEENFVASDITALLPVTRRFQFLENGDVALVRRRSVEIFDANGKAVERRIIESELTADAAERGRFRHYMQKEIHEQSIALAETLEGRIDDGQVLDNVFGPDANEILAAVEGVHIVACGTSYHAGLVARYQLEELARLPCMVDIASEYRYRRPVVLSKTLFVVISQSGETADTLAALRAAQELGYLASLAICNVAESSLVRETDLVLMTRAGPEIGVASTKAFTTQLAAIALLTIVLAKHRGLEVKAEQDLVKQLAELPALVERTLALDGAISTLAEDFADKHHALFLGRGVLNPIAMEGALKLKEISYIHAEAYPAGELKHGPLALVDDDMPVVTVAPNNELLEKLKSNLQEVRARGGQLYVFADADAEIDAGDGVHIIRMPAHATALQAPVVYTIPLQLLAYHAAVLKGTDIDQPRNLAKSVTVE